MSKYDFFYTPYKLIEIKNSIVSSNVNKVVSFKKYNDAEERLLMKQKIDKTPYNDIRDIAFSLNNRELYILINYLAGDDFTIDPDKVYEIIRLRFKKNFANILWELYQNNYFKKTYVHYFTKFCNEFKDAFIELFRDEKILQFINEIVVRDDVIKSACINISKRRLDLDKFLKLVKS